MTLGKRISALRKDKRLSQEYVAETLNVSRQAVSKWENDLSSPDTDNLIALAKLLDVDVAFLATGQLTEEMESDPIPDLADAPKQQKPKREHKKLLSILLAISVLLNILFIGLWRYEKGAEKLMEEYCAASAANAATHFADFVHQGGDGAYWQGVAAFRSFMTAYKWVRNEEPDSSYNYQQCNILLGCLLFDRQRCEEYMEQIRRIMRLLGEDMDSINTYHELTVLNNEIRYGD